MNHSWKADSEEPLVEKTGEEKVSKKADIWKLETPDEEVAIEQLNLIIDHAFGNPPVDAEVAQKYLEEVFEEKWESVKKKLETATDSEIKQMKDTIINAGEVGHQKAAVNAGKEIQGKLKSDADKEVNKMKQDITKAGDQGINKKQGKEAATELLTKLTPDQVNSLKVFASYNKEMPKANTPAHVKLAKIAAAVGVSVSVLWSMILSLLS